MEKVDLPISKLSLAQKLLLMESLWDNLTEDESVVQSPAWHEAVLVDRKEAYEAGKAPVTEWEKAKKRIRKKVS